MDTKTDFTQLENVDTKMDLNPFTTIMLKHHKSKGKLITCMVEAHKKKPKKPQTNGGLSSLFSPKQCNKSDSSSSDSHSMTTLDSKHNQSDNCFAPLSKNFYQAGSN